MTLRTKTLLIIGTTLAALILLLYILSQIILLDSFTRLEAKTTQENVERALNTLAEEAATLSATTADWAYWDDTYAFIQEGNEDYIAANLPDDTFITLELNVALYIASSGEVVFGKAFDLHESRTTTLPQPLVDTVVAGDLRTTEVDGMTGIVLLREAPMLVSVHPILTSQRRGPVQGTLLFGRYLDTAQIQGFAETTRLSLSLYPLTAEQMPADVQAAAAVLSEQTAPFAQPLNEQTIAGYALVNDLYGHPGVILKIEAPRLIYEYGQAGISYLVLSLLVAGLVAGIVALALLEKVVLARLARLSASILQTGNSTDLSLRVSVTGSDELTHLAEVINWRLEALEEVQKELHRLNVELETRIWLRTDQLQRAKEDTEAILNSTRDAIAVIRTDGSISQANAAFNELFGYQVDEALGINLTAVIDEQNGQLAGALDTVAGGNQSKRREVTARRRDETTFDADMILAPIRGESNRTRGIICSLRDITERKQIEANLRESLEKEKHLNELKSRLSSMISHEFRTPLATIQSSADLVRYYGHKMTEERRDEHLAKIQAEVTHLTALLEDILTVNKEQTVGLEFKPSSVDLEAICTRIVQQTQQNVGATHQIGFTSNVHGVNVMADEKLLQQAFTNLLSNAIKYSPEGSTVFFDLSCADAQMVIRVQDQGIGIPKEDQQHLFQIFHRASNVGDVSGSGLGLVITKQAIEKHGGAISFESEVGVGTTFTVMLPLCPASVVQNPPMG